MKMIVIYLTFRVPSVQLCPRFLSPVPQEHFTFLFKVHSEWGAQIKSKSEVVPEMCSEVLCELVAPAAKCQGVP